MTTSRFALEITQMGNSLGVALPDEVLAELVVGRRDRLFLTRHAVRYDLTRPDPEFARQMALAHAIMARRHDVLGVLAKSVGEKI